MIKHMLIVLLLFVSISLFSNELASFRDDLVFIKQFRYQKGATSASKYVNEHKKILGFVIEVYFDLAIHRKFRYEKGILERLNSSRFRQHPLKGFAVICDQLVRNSAFDENLHKVNIRTGLAVDLYFFPKRRR